MKKIPAVILFLLAVSYNTFALDLSITNISAEASLLGEYNRNFNFFGASLKGAMDINDNYGAKTGILYGRAMDITEFGAFTSFLFYPSLNKKHELSLNWIYNGLFGYGIHTNTLMPLYCYTGKRLGASIGVNFRFTSFFAEKAIFETVPAYSVFLILINNETLIIKTTIGNYNDFYARNLSAYSLAFYSAFRISDNWHFSTEIELMESGGLSISNAVYGFSWKGGFRYTW